MIWGDTQRLAALTEGLKRLPQAAQEKVAARGAEEVAKMTRGQFRRSEDPWGTAFAPLIRGRGRPIRELVKGLRVVGVVGKVSASFEQPYAVFHEKGTRKMAARPPLPPMGKMPTRWSHRLISRMNFEVSRQLRALGAR